jgi:hypothetical protein
MPKRIIYTRPDGGFDVVIPSVNYMLRQYLADTPAEPGESADAWFARVFAQSVPADATDVQVIDVSDLPADQAFRGAWVRQGGAVVVDMARAREIHAATIAVFAEKAQQALDVLALRGEDVTARRQAVVDAVAALDLSAASTTDELKALWPEGLPR